MDGIPTQCLAIRLCQYPADAPGQILGVAIVGHIAVAPMINLLRDTANLKADTGHATGHCLHNRIGQVLRQGG